MFKESVLFQITSIIVFTTCLNFSKSASLSKTDLINYKDLIEDDGLYNKDDNVTILTVSNFKNEVYNKPYAILIEFYVGWCGDCQRYAPLYKSLATDTKKWNDMIVLAVIDCSDEVNFPICRDFDIKNYPTLRYLHENYKEGPSNIGVALQKGEDIYAQKKILLEQIMQELRKNRGHQYPYILPVTFTNGLRYLPKEAQYAFLVLEDSKSYIGPELAMDLSSVHELAVIHVQDDSSKMTPALFVLNINNKTAALLGKVLSSKESVASAIKKYLKPKGIEIPDVTTKDNMFTGKWEESEIPETTRLNQARAKEALKLHIKKTGDSVFQDDLEMALRYSLKHEVGSAKSISGERLTALKNYLTVLIKYFPFGITGKQFLVDLQNKISSGGETLKGSDVSMWVQKAEDQHVFSTPAQWIRCLGSSKRYRRYPCGLWTLFHYLTVSAAEHKADTFKQNPREVLDAMHGYIKNFFGCRGCSQHFQEMALKNKLKDVNTLDGAILWLWIAHNEVNERLSKDITEDPFFPKVQFPKYERCPKCRSNNTWNLNEVFAYLKQVYSKNSIRYASYTKL